MPKSKISTEEVHQIAAEQKRLRNIRAMHALAPKPKTLEEAFEQDYRAGYEDAFAEHLGGDA